MGHFTFISTDGPRLNSASTKAMRAHTTKRNFARRRQRLVQQYNNQEEAESGTQLLKTEDGMPADERVDRQLSSADQTVPARIMNEQDAFLINDLTHAMQNLDLVADFATSDVASNLIDIDWTNLLHDPTMLDVSIYFAREVHAARSPHSADMLAVDLYKGNALRSMRQRVGAASDDFNDGVLAAVLLMTIADQALGNTEAWKAHMCGLLQIIAIRSESSHKAAPVWILDAIPHIILQEALLFTRRDAALSKAIKQRGVLDPMFSDSNKEKALHLFTNVEEIAAILHRHDQAQQLSRDDLARLRKIIKSLDQAAHPNSAGHTVEAFLTAKALSIKIFLGTMVHGSTSEDDNSGHTAEQLMQVLQEPQDQISPLTLCVTLGSVFWQTMMGAIAASNAQTRSFYTSRLQRIVVPLALKSWADALTVLQRFLWISSIFSGPCHRIGAQGFFPSLSEQFPPRISASVMIRGFRSLRGPSSLACVQLGAWSRLSLSAQHFCSDLDDLGNDPVTSSMGTHLSHVWAHGHRCKLALEYASSTHLRNFHRECTPPLESHITLCIVQMAQILLRRSRRLACYDEDIDWSGKSTIRGKRCDVHMGASGFQKSGGLNQLNLQTWEPSSPRIATTSDVKSMATHSSNTIDDGKAIAGACAIYDEWPLNHPRDIRVLELYNNPDLHAPLEGGLLVTSLAETSGLMEFDALSYTWDPPFPDQHMPNQSIRIRNQLFTITGNLDRALRRLRARSIHPIWVDMICINQNDDTEKGRQVMLMFDIFSAASAVIAWLGEDVNADAQYVLGSSEPKQFGPEGRSSLRATFASRRYFHRRWVIQELVAALRFDDYKVTFLYGPEPVPWLEFKQRLASFRDPDFHVTTFMEAIAPFEQSATFAIDSEACVIIRQLHNVRDLHCQDDRDRIYALSNLWQGVPVVVDYSLSCAEVYIHFMLSLFSRASQREAGALGFEILALAAYQKVSSSAKDRFDSLASWMPDWRLDLPVLGWNSGHSAGLSRKGYLEGFNGHHALILQMMVYGVIYDASSNDSADVLTADADAVLVSGMECPPTQAFQEGDILCRPKLDSDFNKDPDSASFVLRPHQGYNDVFSVMGRWKLSNLPNFQKGVPRKVIII